MAAPKALARASLRFQPYTPARLPKGSPLPVQSADGTPIPNVTATPWSTDGSNALWELSTGDVVDIEGNVVLLRDSDSAGNPIYFSKEGNTLSADLVEMTKQGVLDEAASNAPDLPPVEPINVELEDLGPVEDPDAVPEFKQGMTPRLAKKVENLKSLANNIGGDILNDAGEGVSNVEVQSFRNAFNSAEPMVQEALLNGDEVTAERVRASLLGRRPGTGIDPATLPEGTAAEAFARAQQAKDQGDFDAYVTALGEFNSFPDEDMIAALDMQPAFEPSIENGRVKRIVAEPWEERPGEEAARAADIRAEQFSDENYGGPPTQDGKNARIRRLKAQRDAGLWDDAKDGGDATRRAGLLEKPMLENRTNAQRAEGQIKSAEEKLTALRKAMREAQTKKEFLQLEAEYDKLNNATITRSRGLVNESPSQLETAQGMARTAIGFHGPRGQQARTSVVLTPEQKAILREEAVLRGEPLSEADLPESISQYVSRDRMTAGDAEAAGLSESDMRSFALGQDGGGKVRGRPSDAGRIQALLALIQQRRDALVPSRSVKGRQNVDELGRDIYTPTGRLSKQRGPRNDNGLVTKEVYANPTAESLFTGPDNLKLWNDIDGFVDQVMGLLPEYGPPGSAAREMAAEELMKLARIVWGEAPQELGPLSSKAVLPQHVADNPGVSSRPLRVGQMGPHPLQLDPTVRSQFLDAMLEERSKAFPSLPKDVEYTDKGWKLGGRQYLTDQQVNGFVREAMADPVVPDELPPVEGTVPDELPPVEGSDPTAAMGDMPSPDEDWVPDHPIDEDIGARPDGELPPVEPIASDDLLDDMLVRADLLREDIRAAMDSGDMEMADQLQQELDVLEGSIADAESGGGAPPLGETLDPLEGSSTPIDDTGPQQRKPQGTPKAKPQPQAKRAQAKKATPKGQPKAQPQPNAQPQPQPQAKQSKAKKATPKAKPQPQAKKATPKAKQSQAKKATPKAKQSQAKKAQPKQQPNSKTNPNQQSTPPKKTDSGFGKVVGGTALVGGGILGGSFMAGGNNTKQPVDDVIRKSLPQDNRQPSDTRDAEERLRSMMRNKRRGYQTGQEPIGRGSF